MLYKLRQRAADESGFTLIELLVVVLIIGILAAIGIPSFLNQRTKAQDADAKTTARTAQTAMETYYTNEQTYNTDAAGLKNVEQTLDPSKLTAASGTANTFTVTATSAAGGTFTIARAANGTVTRSCNKPGDGACKSDSTW
jgi:type IV pilus assembly protein PilA